MEDRKRTSVARPVERQLGTDRNIFGNISLRMASPHVPLGKPLAWVFIRNLLIAYICL